MTDRRMRHIPSRRSTEPGKGGGAVSPAVLFRISILSATFLILLAVAGPIQTFQYDEAEALRRESDDYHRATVLLSGGIRDQLGVLSQAISRQRQRVRGVDPGPSVPNITTTALLASARIRADVERVVEIQRLWGDPSYLSVVGRIENAAARMVAAEVPSEPWPGSRNLESVGLAVTDMFIAVRQLGNMHLIADADVRGRLARAELQRFRSTQALFWLIGLVGVASAIVIYRQIRALVATSEEALAYAVRSEDSLAQAQGVARIGNWVLDLGTGHVEASSECRRLWNSGAADISGSEVVLWRIDPRDRERVEREFHAGSESGLPFSLEYRVNRTDTEAIWVETRCTFASADGGSGPVKLLGTMIDRTKERDHEEQMRKALSLKETLLQEVQHRVKNNLQIVLSLLRLQAGRVDGESRVALDTLGNRVRAMASIHDKFFGASDLQRIVFGEYVEGLARDLIQAARIETEVNLDFSADPLILDVGVAQPCGLLIQEILTNALKHAFVGRHSGTITITMRRSEGSSVEIVIADDGIGLPPEGTSRPGAGIGLSLVDALAVQLSARTNVGSGPAGTRWSLVFDAPEEMAVSAET